MYPINTYLVAFLSCVVIINCLRPHAIRIGLVDVPDKRKQHTGHIPLIGGLAIYAAFSLSCFTTDLPQFSLFTLIAAGFLLVVVGLVDDWMELSTGMRLISQIVAVLVMSVWGDVILRDMGALTLTGGLYTLGIMAYPLTIFATVGVINAINMSDGMDGLSGSLVLVAITGLASVAWLAESMAYLQTLLLLACAVLAFLFFNIRIGKKCASVFLGDAGAMFLGLTLSWYVISISQAPERLMAPVTALWFLLVPLYDTVGVLFRRILMKRSPFRADRGHLHHILLAAGFSVNQSLVIIICIAAAAMSFGFLGHVYQLNELGMFVTFLIIFAIYFWILMRCSQTGKLLHIVLNVSPVVPRDSGVIRAVPQNVKWIHRRRRVPVPEKPVGAVEEQVSQKTVNGQLKL